MRSVSRCSRAGVGKTISRGATRGLTAAGLVRLGLNGLLLRLLAALAGAEFDSNSAHERLAFHRLGSPVTFA